MLNFLNFDKSQNCRVRTYAAEVTTRGFKFHVESLSNTELSGPGVSWASLHHEKEGIVSETFSTDDFRPFKNPQPNTQGTVSFRPGFTKPPRIFLVLNKLYIDSSSQTRVGLSSSGITGEQMEWRIDSWGTIFYAAAGT